MARSPNILYIHSHDTGRYVQPYGHAIPTPNIQRLAERGVIFRQAYCAAPTCSPSRAALLTGQAAHSSGMLGLSGLGPFDLRDNQQHIVHTLRAAGYHTAQCGLQHVAREGEQVGYDQTPVARRQNRVADVAPAAIDFLRHAPPQPFFLDVGFFETHRFQSKWLEGTKDTFGPLDPADDGRYTSPPPSLPDTPEICRDMASFREAARVLDGGVGAVLDALDNAGLAEDTLVVCTTDHGAPFPTMKCNLTDGGTGVMLILRGPGGFTGGKVVNALVSHIDLFPTICELLGIERPPWLQGRSLVPLVSGEKDAINDAVFAEINYHDLYDPQRTVRTTRWRYIRRFLDHPEPAKAVVGNTDVGLSKQAYLDHGWEERPYDREQLYDLFFDPHEAHNLAADPAHRGVLEEMRARLECWMSDTDDPLLRGPVPLPPGIEEKRTPDGFLEGLPHR